MNTMVKFIFDYRFYLESFIVPDKTSSQNQGRMVLNLFNQVHGDAISSGSPYVHSMRAIMQ